MARGVNLTPRVDDCNRPAIGPYIQVAAGDLRRLLRRAIAISPIKPEPKSQAAAGMGTAVAPANPVNPLGVPVVFVHGAVSEVAQGKACISATWPMLFAISTFCAEVHVPLVS